MNLKLYNTLTRKVADFVPLDPPEVKFYACGPTVYDYTHIGHLRKYVMDDVLVKLLRYLGYQVKHVQNVTDVGHLASDADTGEDKLEKGAKKYQLDVWQIARQFEDYFFHSMELVKVARPDVVCRATEHIEAQLKLVQELEAKGLTYVIPGDGVYFDTSLVDDYAQLAGFDPDELQAGARVEMVAGKRHPTDFALWKFERPGENRAMVWPSPWAERSFPGWHIECSAMSMQYLGPQLDIHTGGIDHIPVHHTNEIAQSEAATGQKPFVRYWVHHNFLVVDGQKMSKSLGNFYTIDQIKDHGFDPLALRLLFLSSHYRHQQNFTWQSLAAAQTSWEKLINTFGPWESAFKAGQLTSPLSEADQQLTKQWQQKFMDQLTDDLNTPAAVSVMWQVVNDNQLSVVAKRQLLLDFDQIFSLGLTDLKSYSQLMEVDAKSLPASVQKIMTERQKAVAAKDWPVADQLRQQLLKLNYQVVDDAQHQMKILASKTIKIS